MSKPKNVKFKQCHSYKHNSFYPSIFFCCNFPSVIIKKWLATLHSLVTHMCSDERHTHMSLLLPEVVEGVGGVAGK